MAIAGTVNLMRAAIFNEPRSSTTGARPDPSLVEPTDAIVSAHVTTVDKLVEPEHCVNTVQVVPQEAGR